MTKQPATLTMRRTGTFAFHTRGASHCGLDALQQCQYTIECRCDAKSLDYRGFLFDQINVDGMFQAVNSTHLSCEQLCEAMARKLFKLVLTENAAAKVQRLAVTISPKPYAASMTFEWEQSGKRHLT